MGKDNQCLKWWKHPKQEPEEQALDAALLNALGKRVDSANPLAPPLHKDIMIRWSDILKEGLPEEEKKELRKKYPTLENCTTMEPPKLNSEIKATVLESIIVRDNKIAEKTAKGVSLSCSNGAATQQPVERGYAR